MSWRERLQSGQLAGIAIHTERATGSGGRRLVIHEYPLQDVHYVEDMGKSAGSQRLTFFLIGADYDLTRDQLIEKLDSAGPHTLIHPHLGTLRVHVQNYDWAITTRKGGFVQFNITYILEGQRQFPRSANASAQQLQTACDNCTETLQAAFVEQFTIAQQPAFVELAAQENAGNALTTLQNLNQQATNAVNLATAVIDDVQAIERNIAAQMQQPALFARRVVGIVSRVTSLGGSFSSVMQGYRSLLSGFSNSAASTVPLTASLTTPSRRRQAQNQTALQNLFTATATVETARAIATEQTPFTTFDEAISSRDTLLAQIDTLIETGTDSEYYAYVDLQTALMQRVNEVAPGLQRIDHIQLQQSVPAHVLAHRIYGDASRADELVNRNRIKHPSFIPAGQDLEVLI